MLLNWSLPALSGIEVCRQLRALPETRDVGVIMTGRTGDRYVVRALGAGPDDYLVKPFSIAELLCPDASPPSQNSPDGTEYSVFPWFFARR